MRGKNYTKQEDAIIRKHISDNAGNIDEAFEKISNILENRSVSSIKNRWYKYLKDNTSDKTFWLFGPKYHIGNTKNLWRKSTKRNVKKHNISMWNKVLKLFGF